MLPSPEVAGPARVGRLEWVLSAEAWAHAGDVAASIDRDARACQ
jgi:hypothetical protein